MKLVKILEQIEATDKEYFNVKDIVFPEDLFEINDLVFLKSLNKFAVIKHLKNDPVIGFEITVVTPEKPQGFPINLDDIKQIKKINDGIVYNVSFIDMDGSFKITKVSEIK